MHEGWMILVTGDKWDMEALERLFRDGDPRVVLDRDDYFVESSDVQAIADERFAETAARELVGVINGAMRIQHGNEFGLVRFGGLVRFNAQGGRAYHDSGTVVARARVRGTLQAVSPEGNPESTPPSRAPDWVARRSDAPVRAVLRILGREDVDWYDLYKVYEYIRGDVGRDQIEQWAPRKEIKRFTHTADNAQAIGDKARHADRGHKPPATPMTFSEAETLINGLAREWLETP